MADKSPFFKEEQNEPSKSGGLFQHKQSAPIPTISGELAAQITSMSRRLKILEERYTNMRKKQQLSDQNFLQVQKDANRRLKAADEELLQTRQEVSDLKEKMRLMIRELKECAKRDDVQLMKKYIDLFDFVKFATHNDVRRIVEDMQFQQGFAPKDRVEYSH